MPREKGGECESGEMVRGLGDTSCSFADTTPVRMPRPRLLLRRERESGSTRREQRQTAKLKSLLQQSMLGPS